MSLERAFRAQTKKNLSFIAAEDYYLLGSEINGVSTNMLIDYFSEITQESYRKHVFAMDLQNSRNALMWPEYLKLNMLELEHTAERGCPVIILGKGVVKQVQAYYN